MATAGAPTHELPGHDAPETAHVDEEIVACDGGAGALGHPRVFLNMEGKGFVDCPYCDKRFILN